MLWRWPCCSSSRRYVYDFLRACSRPLVRLRAAPSSVAGCVFVVLNGLEALQARQRTRPVDLGEAETRARHAAHRYSAAAAGVTLHDVGHEGVPAELHQYDDILHLPRLGTHGQRERHEGGDKLVRLNAKEAASDVTHYFNGLVHDVVAVPTGKQREALPSSSAPQGKRKLSGAAGHGAGPSATDTSALRQQLRSLSRAVVALR